MKPMLENKENEEDYIDSQRAQWLQPSVLGLVSTASLLVGVGAFDEDVKLMVLAGCAGLVGGACSLAVREYVSVSSQLDIELAQIKRDNVANKNKEAKSAKKVKLQNPFKAAGALAIAFSLGAMVPLLAAVAAAAVRDHNVRLGVVAGATSLALLGFGGLGSVSRKAPLLKSSLRVLVGGWIAMGITFGLTTLIGTSINWKF